MNKLKKVLLVLGLGFSLMSAPSANAAMAGMAHFSVMGGINDTLNTFGGIGYTAGATLEFRLGPIAEFSIGGLYLSRAFSVPGVTIANSNTVQIPAILYFRLLHVIHIGGGAFYEIPITSGAGNNYGVLGALRIKPMLFPLFVEGRFNYGLNTSLNGANSREIQALVGVLF